MKKILPLLCALLFSGALFSPAVRAADYTNSIGMRFKNIPAGSFYMGSCKPDKKREFMGLPCPSGADVSPDDEADDDETPQHKVRISRGFRMGVHEVTLGQFKQYIADAGRDDLLTDRFIRYNRHGDRAPVTEVSWHHAQDFIDWLNKKEDTRSYRLPTEAEWEYAARAGTTTRYSWGNAIGRKRARCNVCGWPWDNWPDTAPKRPAPVGSFAANAFGLYDMHGNVKEWVEDCWHDNYKGAPTDGRAWKAGCDSKSAVLRGGSWNSGPWSLRSANRGSNIPLHRNFDLGFRLVQDINP